MQNFDEPFFLFLGETDREGVTSKMITSGISYKKKRFESSVQNWKKIIRLLHHPNLIGVLAKFTNRTFKTFDSDLYSELAHTILKKVAETNNIVFVHESFYTGRHNLYEDYAGGREQQEEAEQIFGVLSDETQNNTKNLLSKYNLNLVTYTTNAELSVMAADFADASARNLLFRIYMPASRMWSSEADTVLSLFKDYLTRVSGFAVRQERYSTAHGEIYEFFGDETIPAGEVPAKFEEFSRFLDECVADPRAAQMLLASMNIDSRAAHDIVEKYSKAGRRLQVDMKHERERKLLSIRHQMEGELSDELAGQDMQAIAALVDATLPKIEGVSSSLLAIPATQGSVSPSLTVNIQPQFIDTVHGIVAREVIGTQNIGPEATQIIELINLYAGPKAPELISAVHELEDTSAKPESRLSAKGKLKSFLFAVGDKAADLGIGLLQGYIEKQLGL